MTITAEEFIRRFLLHVLPDNFTKIKHYGLLSNRSKKSNIKFCRLVISKILSNKFVSTITRKFNELSARNVVLQILVIHLNTMLIDSVYLNLI